MKRTLVTLLMLAAVMCGAAGRAQAEPLVALISTVSFNPVNTLLRFDSATPAITTTVPITGLQANEFLLGIDFRPANGLLYGLTNLSRLYTIDPTTGAATVASTLSTALTTPNSSYGIDFNPTVDRLRIVAINDQNVSVDVTTGTVTIQTPINPGSASITGSAYTNNFAGATSTTLYGINFTDNTLVIQNPPASGTVVSVGSLNVFNGSLVGFDISGLTGTAYGVFNDFTNAELSALYTINLSTGLATRVGLIGTGFNIDGLAAPIGAPVTSPVPEPTTMLLLGTGLAGVALQIKRRRRAAKE